MNSSIKNIIFDWGGVLINLDIQGCVRQFEEAGIANLNDFLSGIHEADLFHRYERGEITTEEFRKGVRLLAKKTLTDDDIDRIWNSILLHIPEYKLKLIMELSQSYRIYLLSNTNDLHWKHGASYAFNYEGKDVKQCFTQIFLSHEMHLAKPNPEIFRETIKQAGLVAEETLFIDDSQQNCQAASSVGLHVAHYIPGDDLNLIFQ